MILSEVFVRVTSTQTGWRAKTVAVHGRITNENGSGVALQDSRRHKQSQEWRANGLCAICTY
jgi:hypothetical protein